MTKRKKGWQPEPTLDDLGSAEITPEEAAAARSFVCRRLPQDNEDILAALGLEPA